MKSLALNSASRFIMEAGSEGEKKQQLEGENRTKRKMKTASQLEILEKTYAGI